MYTCPLRGLPVCHLCQGLVMQDVLVGRHCCCYVLLVRLRETYNSPVCQQGTVTCVRQDLQCSRRFVS